MGFEDMNECPQLCKLARDYLKTNKGCEDNIFAFFANEPNPESLYVKLVEELDKCILAYFAFHWNHATLLVSQVMTHSIVLILFFIYIYIYVYMLIIFSMGTGNEC